MVRPAAGGMLQRLRKKRRHALICVPDPENWPAATSYSGKETGLGEMPGIRQMN